MKKISFYFILCVLFFSVQGCSQIIGTKYKKAYLSVVGDRPMKDNNGEVIFEKDGSGKMIPVKTKETIGSLFLWEADTSAAVVYPKDSDGNSKMCMQWALAVKSSDMSSNLKVSDTLLNLSKAVSSMAAAVPNGGTPPQSLVDMTNTLKETTQLLTKSSDQSTYLNVGMFFLCQMAANGDITTKELNSQVTELIKASAFSQQEAN